MALERAEVRRLADLARLALSSEEERRLAKDLHSILDHVACLGDVLVPSGDPDDLPETRLAEGEPSRISGIDGAFRRNAPRLRDDFLVVPAVLPSTTTDLNSSNE